jgi:transcriptional regulator with XRE-family HTH domain
MSGAHDPLYIEFIARLRHARKRQNLSQQQLGERLGKEQTFVSKVETCERRLDVVEAAKWCAALGLYLEDVLPSEIKQKIQKEEKET